MGSIPTEVCHFFFFENKEEEGGGGGEEEEEEEEKQIIKVNIWMIQIYCIQFRSISIEQRIGGVYVAKLPRLESASWGSVR